MTRQSAILTLGALERHRDFYARGPLPTPSAQAAIARCDDAIREHIADHGLPRDWYAIERYRALVRLG